MIAKITLSFLYLLLLASFTWVASATAQGCALLNKTIPAQYLFFEKIIEASEQNIELPSSTQSQNRERIVLRLLNNTNCDILFRSYERPDTRTLEMIKLPNGGVSFKFNDFEDLHDGGWLLGLAYSVQFREPLPEPKKRFYQVDDVMPPEYRLQAGRSVLFTVPLSLFDRWINLNVAFDYDWDQNLSDVKYWRAPSHNIFFGNEDLPEEVFRRTKSCKRVNGCNPARPNTRLERSRR